MKLSIPSRWCGHAVDLFVGTDSVSFAFGDEVVCHPRVPFATRRRLQEYAWPGNVRELANVIERGVIVSRGGVFDVDRALSDLRVPEPVAPAPAEVDGASRIFSAPEIEELERANIMRALAASEWKVAGERAAAALLQLNPSTLSSRMRALGIRRPSR